MFTHLHRHSDASILDGAGTSWQFAERAAQLGQSFLSQTDHGNINGALKHWKACEEYGLVPIQGVEAYYRPNRHVRDPEWRYRRWHMVLLALNLRGWHNLIRITSEAFASGFYQSPCIDDDLIDRYSEGLLCSGACALGPVAHLIENGTDKTVDEFIIKMKNAFDGRFFLEIQPHDWDRQRSLNVENVSLGNRHSIGVYATVDSHYVDADWADTQKIIALIGTNTTVAEAAAKNQERLARGDEVYELGHEGLHLMSEDEVRDRFMRFHPDLGVDVVDRAISTTMDVARMVKPYLTDRSLKMPRIPAGIDPEKELIAWCREGMHRIGRVGDEIYEKQLDYELEIIRARSNFPYMWIVGDLVRWARSDAPLPPSEEEPNPPKKRPIRLGPGRGSAGGSLVCYLCGITGIDPIAHHLRFERFMNPGRKGIPDIDLDFESAKVPGYASRPIVKEYLARKHGRNAVADVVSYATFQPRAAIKDVARIMGIDYLRTQQAIDVIDPVEDQDLEEMRLRMPTIDAWASEFPEAWKHATRIENQGNPLVSRMSKHAGGVVILPGEVTDHMAVVRAAEDEPGYRTAWSETPQISICDEFGILKIDVLGLAGIARQQMAIDSILEHTEERVDLDSLSALSDPHDVDPEVMKVFQAGHTLGINQFGGTYMTSFLRQLHPENLIDLAAANALYRPGPIGGGAPWLYAKRKRGEEAWSVPPILADVLEETYAVMAFQEQVMAVFQAILGYTAGQADDIRKEIDKYNRAHSTEGRRRLALRKDEFIAAGTEKISADDAERLWAEILPFTGYSFNRAHATGYAIQAYQDAYLKRYYPAHFYMALLTTSDEFALQASREARFFDVSTLPPDINISRPGFMVDIERNALRYGLSAVKNVGDIAADQLIVDRPFASQEDFEQRSSRKYSKVNSKVRDALLRVGALDCFGAREDWEPVQRAQGELELLGVALEPGGLLGEDSELVWESVYSEQEIEEAEAGAIVIVGGTPVEVSRTTVKKGRQSGSEMAFVTFSLDLESYRVTCFPDTWAQVQYLIEPGGPMLIVKGNRDDRGGIIGKQMMDMRAFINDRRASLAEAA